MALDARFLALLAAASACWTHSSEQKRVSPTIAVPRIQFVFSAADLSDEDTLPRVQYRANVRRCARYRVDPSLPLRVPDHPDVAVRELPVIGMDKDFVGLVVENGHARFVVWCDAHGISESVVVPVELKAGRDLTSPTGITLLPGIDIHSEPNPTGGSVRVDFSLGDQKIEGWIAKAAVGPVWLMERPTRPTHVVVSGTTVYADPLLQHAVLLVPQGGTAVVGSRRSDAFVQITAQFDRLRVQGFVAPNALQSLPPSKPSHRVLSQAPRVDSSESLPAGVCLFAGGTNNVLGVTTSDTLKPHASPLLGFWSVYLDTAWGQVELIARDQNRSRRVTSAKWELCNAN